MVRDPLYRSIESRLGERLDPELFERCAVELLREAYPGITPIRGGDDGGMDGAISIGAGAPLPLVVTTGKNVIGNLTRSLGSYRRTGGSARQAVLATSQALTGRKRRNLRKRARELGFTLRNIHDHADFVGRLYRNPLWRRKLLGLTGDLPALSVLPDGRRARPHMRLVGRDGEMDWLRSKAGDVVVVGQPGVGKTALLEALAKEGGGLFPIATFTRSVMAEASGDMRQIADAFREQRPPRIFVDDAHLRGSLIESMARLRDDIGAEFAIVATTWPSHEGEARRQLYCSSERVLRVGGLDRKTAEKKSCGKCMPDSPTLWLARFSTRALTMLPTDDPRSAEYHSGGHVRPGLAVTLARYASLGDLADLADRQIVAFRTKEGCTVNRIGPGLSGGIRPRGICRHETSPSGGSIVERRLRRDVRAVAALRVSGTGIQRDHER